MTESTPSPLQSGEPLYPLPDSIVGDIKNASHGKGVIVIVFDTEYPCEEEKQADDQQCWVMHKHQMQTSGIERKYVAPLLEIVADGFTRNQK